MLFSLGILNTSKVIEVTPGDLTGNLVHDGSGQTRQKIQEAMGGVLFIDEAYNLNQYKGQSTDQGKQVLAELLKAMEEYKDQLVVIFAGYEKETKDLFKMNPGLKSRIGYTFIFDDYTPEELQEMFRRKMVKSGFGIDEGALDKALRICTYFSKTKDFGNGRFVDNLVAETIRTHAQRPLSKAGLMKIIEEDIPEIEDFSGAAGTEHKDYEEALKDIVGLKQVKLQMQNFEASVKFQIAAEKAGLKLPAANRHMLFLGNPGTGKTTVARIAADMLYDMGITHSRKLVETERKDLVGTYVGQTAQKTTEKIEEALGGVLFIDEAYALASDAGDENGFGAECITTLIKAMEDHKEDLIVIFAGYKKEMQTFIKANSGIASRIGYTFNFEDYDPDELTEIFKRKIASAGFKAQKDVCEKVREIMQYFCHVENFGNGRFVDKVITLIIDRHGKNYLKGGSVIELAAEDVPTIEDMLGSVVGGENMVDPDDVTDAETYRIAFHELGHALVQLKLCPEVKIERITVKAEGTGALGYVQHQNSWKNQNTRTDYLHMITVKMAGMACEEVMLGEYADGGSADIEQAGAIAQLMTGKLGMSESGFLPVDKEKQGEEIARLLKQGFLEAKEILEGQRELIREKAEILMKQGVIDAEDLREK